MAGGKHTGKLVSLRLSESELALLDKLAKVHSTKKAAIVAGLRLLESGADIDLAAALRRAAGIVEAYQKAKTKLGKKG